MSHPIPTTIVAGALGVGKTTAILDLLGRRPAGERWAVLVNEFGQVGIDGAILGTAAGEGGGIEVREIAGGCICCTANLPLRVGLVRLVRELAPDRLLIEPTGLAHPASIVDVARSLKDALALRATITLVDPRRLAPGDPVWVDQVRAADVLVASWADVASADQLAAFRAMAADQYPPPLLVATTDHGKLDPAWLDLDPSPRGISRIPDHSALPGELGLVWPPERVFRMGMLQDLLQDLVRPGELLPDGVLRLKGVFRTERAVVLVQGGPDSLKFEPIGWRRDSRLSLVVPGEAPDADRLIAAFTAVLAS